MDQRLFKIEKCSKKRKTPDPIEGDDKAREIIHWPTKKLKPNEVSIKEYLSGQIPAKKVKKACQTSLIKKYRIRQKIPLYQKLQVIWLQNNSFTKESSPPSMTVSKIS